MFIRIKKISTNSYAYLVKSVWKKQKTTQKVVKYLGKIIEHTQQVSIQHTQPQTIIQDFFTQLGFTQKGFYFYNSDYMYSTKTQKIINSKTKKPVVFRVNDGFVCQYTLKNLQTVLEKPYSIKTQKEDIALLAKTIVDAGINLDKNGFIELYSQLAKIEL